MGVGKKYSAHEMGDVVSYFHNYRWYVCSVHKKNAGRTASYQFRISMGDVVNL